MIKIAICDDEQTMLDTLKNHILSYLERIHDSAQLFLFLNPQALLAAKDTFDIVFLDIQMEGMTGLEAAQKLRQAGSESFVVFVTVLKECVYDAFSVEASDYLLKPIDQKRFVSTMNRIFLHIQNGQKNSLLIQKGAFCQRVRFSDILYCEAINRKIFVHTRQGVIDYYFKIKELENQLQSCFFRCHRSYLVNLQFVCGYEDGLAKLENGESLPVSRLRQEEFVKSILGYMKNR